MDTLATVRTIIHQQDLIVIHTLVRQSKLLWSFKWSSDFLPLFDALIAMTYPPKNIALDTNCLLNISLSYRPHLYIKVESFSRARIQLGSLLSDSCQSTYTVKSFSQLPLPCGLVALYLSSSLIGLIKVPP